MLNKLGSFEQVVGMSMQDQQHSTLRDSDIEVPLKELSGDEAIEKSFMNSNMQSSVWQRKNQKSSLFLSSIIIMKSMVGVGILGIPAVAKNFGVILTALLLGLIFAIGIMSSGLLLKCKNLSRHSNFSTIGFHIFRSRWIIIVVNLCIIFTNLGVCISELIIFGDTTQNLVLFWSDKESVDELSFFESRTFFIICISIALYPALIVKSIEKLKFVSLTAIISICTFTVLVTYNFFKLSSEDKLSSDFAWWIPEKFEIKNALAALPTLLLAFSWQFNLFPVFKSMEKASDKRLIQSTVMGFFAGSFLYLTVGILGYASYGNVIQTNYLNSLQSSDVGSFLYVILNLTFVVSTTLTLPVIFFGGRNNFIQLLKSLSSTKTIDSQKDNSALLEKGIDNTKDINYVEVIRIRKRSQAIRFYGITTCLFAVLSITAIFVTDLGLVYNLLGSITCNAIQLGLPTLFYFQLVRIKRNGNFVTKSKKIFYHFIQVMFVISLVLTVVCVVAEIIKE